MKALSNILSAAEVEFSGISIGGISYIVIFKPYRQRNAEQGFAFVDSYFAASNAIYFIKKELVVQLKLNGFEAIEEIPFQYKHLAFYSGIGEILHSTLLASKKYGTRIALEVIAVKGVFFGEMSAEKIVEPPVSECCKSCRLCEKSCPSQCIGIEFEWRKCVRNLQNGGFIENEKTAAAMGNCVWGCDICQSVCPANRGVETDLASDEFELTKLFDAFAGGKKTAEPYRNALGGNYLRPARLLALVINAMTNSPERQKYAPLVESVKEHPDERVRKAVERFFSM